MSDIFERDYEADEDISGLEDDGADGQDGAKPRADGRKGDPFVFPRDLFYAKLEYSSEGVYVSPGELSVRKGDKIIIQTRYGKDIAVVMGKIGAPVGVKQSEIVRVERVATAADLAAAAEMAKREDEAFRVFREKVRQHRLDMKLISVHFLIEEPKALFFFSSETRVDFRELVKDLVYVFKMRIELRQIGVRDESRITGGLGVCGRPYCCHAISDKLPPVSIKMAKEQNLSLNSMKISGQCGRLLCCLSYEYGWYAEVRKKLPNEGLHLAYDGVNFKITDVNPLTQMVKMLGEDGRLLELPAKRFAKENGRWKVV